MDEFKVLRPPMTTAAVSPDWPQDSKTAVIGDVDCTVHEAICSKYGVKGYPTLKHGDVNSMEDYSAGRTIDDLRTFAKENLGPSCGPANLDLCDAEQKSSIETALALSTEEIDTKIADGEKAMADAETTFTAEVEKLQKRYEELTKEKEDTIANVKKSGLGLLKSVKAHKAN